MKLITTLVSLLFFSGPVLAELNYIAKVEILSGNKSIGAPTMLIKPGINVGAAVEGSYSLSIKALPAGEGLVFIETNLEVGEEKYTPAMTVEFGKEAKVSMGEISLIIIVKES